MQSGSGHPFEGTYFDAAIDARHRRPWPPQSTWGSLESRFRTQQRHLDRAALVLGIDASIDENQRERIAHVLSIPGQLIHDSAGLIENQHAYSIMGDGICRVLDRTALSTSIFQRLAMAGAIAGVWPAPQWDHAPQTWPISTFHQPGTRASPD